MTIVEIHNTMALASIAKLFRERPAGIHNGFLQRQSVAYHGDDCLQRGTIIMISEHCYPTIDGQVVTIRPIRISDTKMKADFVRALSPQSRHFRFLGGLKELSPQQLKKFCDVDGRHTMAFVATVKDQGREIEIGVGRYAANSKEDTREMAVTVADDWQQKGLGLQLTNQLIEFARGHGIKQLYSVALADNIGMRELARRLGMSVKRDPDDRHQVIYTLAL